MLSLILKSANQKISITVASENKCNCTEFSDVASSIKTRRFGLGVNLGLGCAVLEHVCEISQYSNAVTPGMLKVDASRAVFGKNQ